MLSCQHLHPFFSSPILRKFMGLLCHVHCVQARELDVHLRVCVRVCIALPAEEGRGLFTAEGLRVVPLGKSFAGLKMDLMRTLLRFKCEPHSRLCIVW